VKQTPSQTVGPFYSIGLTRVPMNVLASGDTQGQRIRIEGQLYDGDGSLVSDAMVEIWQANTYGRYNHPDDKQEKPIDLTFSGWGRCGTDKDGLFWFETIKPGPVPANDEAVQAPHVNVTVFARGMLVHAFTRIYFDDEPANENDAVLMCVNEPRRSTLIARRQQDQNGKAVYRFDIRLQGKDETVFFDV
jgi:protocatechuate 3,4-dioxygenase, alpha subunit